MQTFQASSSAPGTCGELVQGRFPDGEDFLVTLPVNLRSVVHVELDFTSGSIRSTPAGKIKTRMAVRKTLNYLGYRQCGAKIQVVSGLPEGKGMASSTADITAACRAAAAAVGAGLSPEEISAVAVEIEPSDGLMYPGVVCYNHRRGRLIETLGRLPPMDILAVDLGGRIDTFQFNRIPKNYTDDELEALQSALVLVRAGVQEQDTQKIGRGALISARVNQRLLPKPPLETLVEIAELCGASGVCAAHSGTMVGMLFTPGNPPGLEKARELCRQRIGPHCSPRVLHSD